MRSAKYIAGLTAVALLAAVTYAAEHTVALRQAVPPDSLPAEQTEWLPLAPQAESGNSLAKLTIDQGKISVAGKGWSTTFDDKTLAYVPDQYGDLQPRIFLQGRTAESLQRYTSRDLSVGDVVAVVLDGRVVAVHELQTALYDGFVLPDFTFPLSGDASDDGSGAGKGLVVEETISIPWYVLVAVTALVVFVLAGLLNSRRAGQQS